jgi:hypothetical protein
MAAVVQRKNFETFCSEFAIKCRLPTFIGSAYEEAFVGIGQFSGSVRGSRFAAMQILDWASSVCDYEVTYTGRAAQLPYSFKREFEDVLRRLPSDCELEPGTAFLIRGEADLKRPRVSLPERAEDGSYAYMVDIKSLVEPAKWHNEASRAGFMVRISDNELYYYGSRFPGGDLGCTPPLRLASKLSKEKLKPCPLLDGIRAEIDGKLLRAPLIGKKAFVKVSEKYQKCAGFRKVLEGCLPQEIQGILTFPAGDMVDCSRTADQGRAGIIMDDLREMADKLNEKNGSVSFTSFLGHVQRACPTEDIYCCIMTRFNDNFIVDWNKSACVSTRVDCPSG